MCCGQLSREEVLAEIKRDYESNYFVNGTGDMNAYEEDCLFTDPFSGFRVGCLPPLSTPCKTASCVRAKSIATSQALLCSDGSFLRHLKTVM